MTYTDKPNYWSLLGLKPGSSYDQVKRAFRREARKWHPDLNGNDQKAEERFKLVNEAYAVLSDSNKRSNWENSSDFERPYIDPFVDGFPHFEDYLQEVLGIDQVDGVDQYEREMDVEEDYQESNLESEWPTPAPKPPPPVQISEDLETIVELTPEQALFGTVVEVEIEKSLIVEVQTPAFAGDGWRLRLAGVAPGGRDHFLQLRVQTRDGLRFDGLRVFYKLDLLPQDAVLGCAIEVPTIDGPVTLQVPPRSSSGRLLRLRGRGLEYDGTKGDQLVELAIVIPVDISDAEEALYRRLQELNSQNDAIF